VLWSHGTSQARRFLPLKFLQIIAVNGNTTSTHVPPRCASEKLCLARQYSRLAFTFAAARAARALVNNETCIRLPRRRNEKSFFSSRPRCSLARPRLAPSKQLTVAPVISQTCDKRTPVDPSSALECSPNRAEEKFFLSRLPLLIMHSSSRRLG
jgi:hypothetical protein